MGHVRCITYSIVWGDGLIAAGHIMAAKVVFVARLGITLGYNAWIGPGR